MALLHSSGQSPPALMLILTILLHPPPTPMHVVMKSASEVTAVMLQ